MKDIQSYRRILHRFPEISGKESKTRQRIQEWLNSFNPDSIIKIGGTGLLATFDSGKPGPCVLIRSELDALPIKEENIFEHVSIYPGIGHKCGHDGHSAILLGLAQKINKTPFNKGKVHLLFQPAEETGQGAKLIMEDEKFKKLQIDFVFALHNIPGEPLHQIILRDDSFTAAVKSIIIELKGKTSHAAEPENGINPTLALAELIKEVDQLQNKKSSEKSFTLLTPIQILLGEEAFGTSAGDATIKYTVRAWTQEQLNQTIKRFETTTAELAKKHSLDLRISYAQEFQANKNDKEAVALIKWAGTEAGYDHSFRDEPFKWGEDFGFFTQKHKGAMFGLGAGENTPALHHPLYDFPDEIIETGVNIFYNLIKKINE
ncbi:MAG: amidohydrolase [Bacteroidota bacterium]|nr:amidohydrolase [Bacteroidota bacterium]